MLNIVALKERCLRVYDPSSTSRHRDPSPEIHKLVVMLPTYLTDSEFIEQTERTSWENLKEYKNKLGYCIQMANQHPFDVEYSKKITQQASGSM